MTEHAKDVKVENGALQERELKSAQDVMAAVVRAAKAMRIYLRNNPVLMDFLSSLTSTLTEHLQSFGRYQVDVQQFTLYYSAVPLYQNRDIKESLAFRLYSEGLRSLLFLEGIDEREIALFLELLVLGPSGQEDHDLVTRLWESGLPHVRYLLLDDLAEPGWEKQETVAITPEFSRLHRDIAAGASLAFQPVPERLLRLTKEEVMWLRAERACEEQRDLLNEVISILVAIVSGSADSATRLEFLEISTRLCRDLLLAGEIARVLKILTELVDMTTASRVFPPEEREVIRNSISALLDEKSVQVLHCLDSSNNLSNDDLRTLLRSFGLSCLREICELLARVEQLRTRKLVIEVLAELGREQPQCFAPFLQDPRWHLVRNVVLTLSLMDAPGTLDLVLPLAGHKEQRVRKEVLVFLQRSSDPRSTSYIIKYLRDPSRPLRMKALQLLLCEAPPYALKPALAVTSAEDFSSKDLEEKVAVYELIGVLGGETVLPMFRSMLLKKHWFKKSLKREKTVCAVAGLLRIRGEAAQRLLEEVDRQRDPELREILKLARNRLAGKCGAAAAGLSGGGYVRCTGIQR